MSRAATSTPPPQTYFPQRNTTPTMRHASAPNVSAAHFASRGYQHQQSKRRVKNLPSASSGSNTNIPLKKPSQALDNGEGLGLSFEDLSATSMDFEQPPPGPSRQNSVASYSSASSVDSFQTSHSQIYTGDSSFYRQNGSDTGRSTPASGSLSSSLSQAPTQLLTPASSQASFPFAPSDSSENYAQSISPNGQLAAPRASWVGKMAMAVVNTGMSIGIPFGQHTRKDALQSPSKSALPAQSPPLQTVGPPPPMYAAACPSQEVSKPTMEELQALSPEAQLARKREWAEAENRKYNECARLCSQWPQSGYNMSKHGPNGSTCFYQPQSFANPQHVVGIMQRQAELERFLAMNAMLFFACRRGGHRDSSSDDDTDPSSVESYQSSQPSPTTSMSFSTDDVLAKQEADIKAAMASPLLSFANLSGNAPTVPSMQLSPNAVKAARSLSDLSSSAGSLGWSKDESAMDVDQSDSGSLLASTDLSDSGMLGSSARAQSCGAKRPSSSDSFEEEKRRKVDEAMVVEEAVETGVIAPPAPTARLPPTSRMSSSVPDLNKARAAQGPQAVFGVVVKTSDTHPIIISPFFPADLLPIVSKHIVMPPPTGPFSQTPLLLGSNIDVPSLLLSHVPSAPNSVNIPSSGSKFFGYPKQSEPRAVGNLLLSSCPGKRLRLDGPSRGRGPVCRDIATDLRRIKSEGVGCLVCCLDDTELALLGVPWETYREVALETGLDVIRVPMPDGFTPVNMALFDSQITLITTKYSLQGINVLVHCRGGVGRAGLTACSWAIKMGFVQPHPSLLLVESASKRQFPNGGLPAELEHQIVMSIVERVIAMIRSRRGLKAIESFEQVQFLAKYVGWLREQVRRG
ncbi:uncharacterized protein IL334_007402 [Kwoniella shivajii]|uniref:Tyrosine specific protein phosphatases domain-containing protein n=1 Tax=Kwoniella shivajii TaxID=564305 RepID=A0ABZ1D8J8_9TREE|nr:hypothetical protein IL334_007402 [Kwoniella shivajii]